jgi:hypothetical protein
MPWALSSSSSCTAAAVFEAVFSASALLDSASSWIVALLVLEKLPPDAPAPGASSRECVTSNGAMSHKPYYAQDM